MFRVFFLFNTRQWVYFSCHVLQELLSKITKNVQITGKISIASLRIVRCLLRRFSVMSYMISSNVFRPPVSLITHTGQGLWEICIKIYFRPGVKCNRHETQIWSTALCKEIL
jgi:hypothetical protein